MFEKIKRKLKIYAPLSLRGWVVYFAVMSIASALCALLMRISSTDVHVPLIFVLVVLLISLMTDGYFYGILAALTSVITVNFAFTYPYAKMDFSIYGYPLTFITMLTVGCAVSTLTTRLKEQERLRSESEREKVRANLLRAVSHDLRTPLTAISGSISAVLDGGDSMDSSQKKELLEGARQDAEWLCRMVENLLSVTRINGSSTGSLFKQDEILEEVLSEAVMNFKKHSSQVDVDVKVPDDLLFVPMDAMLIEQVLLNLMENAVRHGDSSKIVICAETDRDNALISVRDNGPGIAPRLMDHLFDGSLSLNGDGADSTRGMGIGLTVCRTIIEAHGGSIRARNIRSGGAEFIITLPLGGEKHDYQGQDTCG